MNQSRNDESSKTRLTLRRAVLGCAGGLVSFIGLWQLMRIEAIQPFLLFPLGVINKTSWAVFGWKLIADGTFSTLFVSLYFILLGVLLGLFLGSPKRRSPNRLPVVQ